MPVQVAQGGHDAPAGETSGHAAEAGHAEGTHASVGHGGGHAGPVRHDKLGEHVAEWYSVMGFLIALAIIVFARVRMGKLDVRRPSKGQLLIEQAVASITHFSKASIGPGGERFAPFVGVVFAFVLFSNLCGVLPMYWLPTGEGMAPALAPLIFPIELIGALVRPLSLAMRLFGNVFGEETVIAVLISMAAVLTSGIVPFQAPMLAFGVFGSIVQAGVFAILTCSYIALSIGDHGDHGHEGHGEHGAAHAH